MRMVWRIAELVEQRGWSVRELAERAGLDRKTVRNVVEGRATRVDLDTIAKLSEALEVGPGGLWRSDREPDWETTAGALRTADPGEVEHIMRGGWEDVPDPALERATRRA